MTTRPAGLSRLTGSRAAAWLAEELPGLARLDRGEREAAGKPVPLAPIVDVDKAMERRAPAPGDGDAIIEVSDTGPGVSPDDLPLIFERFHRGSGPRAAGAPGVGLGLAICRALVEREGGRV